MNKLNVLPVSLLGKQISKNNMLFSHEPCDVCQTQGIKLEAVSYAGLFDYTQLRYYSATIKSYRALPEEYKQYYNRAGDTSRYMIYYLCSPECATMLQFQLGE